MEIVEWMRCLVSAATMLRGGRWPSVVDSNDGSGGGGGGGDEWWVVVVVMVELAACDVESEAGS